MLIIFKCMIIFLNINLYNSSYITSLFKMLQWFSIDSRKNPNLHESSLSLSCPLIPLYSLLTGFQSHWALQYSVDTSKFILLGLWHLFILHLNCFLAFFMSQIKCHLPRVKALSWALFLKHIFPSLPHPSCNAVNLYWFWLLTPLPDYLPVPLPGMPAP